MAALTPEQVFEAWMTNTFALAAPGTYNIVAGTQTPVPNCFAWAVGVTDRAIRPQTWDALATAYAEVGYYNVPLTGPPANDDAEVYARDTDVGRPLHAHRVTDAANGTCESKMGDDFRIQHHRDMLQCTHLNGPTFEYGVVQARYRYDATRLRQWQEGEVTTSSGRKLKRKDAAWTSSGRPISKDKKSTTKSGRVVKKGGKKGGVKAAANAPKPTGQPTPQTVVKAVPHRAPPGGFKKPTARTLDGKRIAVVPARVVPGKTVPIVGGKPAVQAPVVAGKTPVKAPVVAGKTPVKAPVVAGKAPVVAAKAPVGTPVKKIVATVKK